MPDLDLIVRGGTTVMALAERRVDLGLAEGKIAAIEPELNRPSLDVIEADGLHIFPGVIDAHVHFNEPGRTHWEGFETGSHAFAAGGGTLFFDMPLNSHPPTLDGDSFDQKLAAAKDRSLTDFAFWGGLVPQNLDKLPELHERGVIGFKAFMCPSGIDDFPYADDGTLREGMKRIAQLGSVLAVHAESESMTRRLMDERITQGRTTIRDYLDSRPIAAELEAIRHALDLAGETGCALHVVHVSCAEAVALIKGARQKGVDVTCESCPHYLTLSEEDMVGLGAKAKCAPPLRPVVSREGLWNPEHIGWVTTIGSDHSPAPPEMKTDDNFFKVWGGVAGVQHTLSLVLTEGHFKRGRGLSSLIRALSLNVADRFHLPLNKCGRIQIGADADLAVVNLRGEFKVEQKDLLDRHHLSPYVGQRLHGKVVRTLLRGITICQDGKIVSKSTGRLVKPVRK